MICSGSSPESEKIHWMLTGACSFTLLIHHATILKNWNGKTYVERLYGMYLAYRSRFGPHRTQIWQRP